MTGAVMTVAVAAAVVVAGTLLGRAVVACEKRKERKRGRESCVLLVGFCVSSGCRKRECEREGERVEGKEETQGQTRVENRTEVRRDQEN